MATVSGLELVIPLTSFAGQFPRAPAAPLKDRMAQRRAPKMTDDGRPRDIGVEIAHLQEEIYLLETLMDNVPDSIYFKDLQSRFTRINRYAAARFGVADPATAVGRTDFDYFTDEHAAQALRDEQEILRT